MAHFAYGSSFEKDQINNCFVLVKCQFLLDTQKTKNKKHHIVLLFSERKKLKFFFFSPLDQISLLEKKTIDVSPFGLGNVLQIRLNNVCLLFR